MAQLLQYGAACNVYYLFTQDTDLLTGPQVKLYVFFLFYVNCLFTQELLKTINCKIMCNVFLSFQDIQIKDYYNSMFFFILEILYPNCSWSIGKEEDCIQTVIVPGLDELL